MKIVYVILGFFSASVLANPDLAKSLVTMRTELESLGQETELRQKELSSEFELWSQKALELQAALQKENLRKLQAEAKTKALARRVQTGEKVDAGDKKKFLAAVSAAQAWVNEGPPFRKGVRLENLDQLKTRAERGLEALEILLAELWQFYEGEFKMAQSHEYKVLEVETPGGVKLAEVVRLGSYLMLAQTSDQNVYAYSKAGQNWQPRQLTGADAEEGKRLVSRLKSKMNSGLYTLPGVSL